MDAKAKRHWLDGCVEERLCLLPTLTNFSLTSDALHILCLELRFRHRAHIICVGWGLGVYGPSYLVISDGGALESWGMPVTPEIKQNIISLKVKRYARLDPPCLSRQPSWHPSKNFLNHIMAFFSFARLFFWESISLVVEWICYSWKAFVSGVIMFWYWYSVLSRDENGGWGGSRFLNTLMVNNRWNDMLLLSYPPKTTFHNSLHYSLW